MRVATKKGDLPVHFGMNTLATFGDLTDKSMNQVMGALAHMTKLKISEVLSFFYAAFKEGATEEGEDCLIVSPREVGGMIDEEPELLTRLYTAYAKQSTPEDGMEPEGEGKKK